MGGLLACHDVTYKILGNILKLSAKGAVWTIKSLANEVNSHIKPSLKRELANKGKHSIQEIQRILYYAKHKGYLDDDLQITTAGKEKMMDLSLQPIPMPKSWNKEWSLIIFDVPERNRKRRHHLRRLIKQLGFVQLQQSVWIHPAPCQKEFKTIKNAYSAGGSLLLLRAKHGRVFEKYLKRFQQE